MIMAGRGRRLGNFGDQPMKVGASQTPNDSPADMPTLLAKIEELDMKDLNSNALQSICNLFCRLCTSKEALNDIVVELHSKALKDINLSKKIVLVLEKLKYHEIDDVSVRTIYFTLLQSAFEEKDRLYQSDPEKFFKNIMLLGTTFNITKLFGNEPIIVLGNALLEYLNMLNVKGGEKELKAFTEQILINGANFSESKQLQVKYDTLKQSLRNSLISRDLSLHSKCWILLAMDFMSNGFRALTGAVKDFYVANLGDEYIKLESLVQVTSPQLNNSTVSPESVKSQDGGSARPKTNTNKRDFSKKFSEMNIKTEEGGSFKGKKVVSPQDKNTKKENWRSIKSASGHDDRFEKDENYYGVQMPRRPKPENQKKNVGSEKTHKESKESTKSPTGFDMKKESQTQKVNVTDENWD